MNSGWQEVERQLWRNQWRCFVPRHREATFATPAMNEVPE